MGTLWQDIRFGFRTLAKSPGFTAIAVMVLALGIGANTAIFSVADAFLLKPLNIPDPAHLFVIGELAPGQTMNTNGVTAANLIDWNEQQKSYEPLGAFAYNQVSLTGNGLPQSVQGFDISQNFFSLCGQQPLLGRVFLPGEDEPGNDGVVILSQRLWQKRYGADPHIIGQNVHIDGRAYTVVGVMPKTFDFPQDGDLWMPLALTPAQRQDRKSHAYMVVGKIKPGVNPINAEADLKTIARRLSDAYPDTNRGWSVRATPIRRFELGDLTVQYTAMLLGAVGFVLLIVCANVANLQFVRGASRHKEMAIRVALGGSQWRLVRQLLTESILVSLAGAALGLVFAKWSIGLMVANMPAEVAKFIPGWYLIRMDMRAVLFTMIAGVAAGVIAGVLPAFQGSRLDVNDVLKEGGRSSSSARGRHRLRNAMVVLQVVLAVALLAVSGLFVRGFRSLLSFNQGYHTESVLTAHLSLPASRYAKPEQRTLFYSQVLEKLAAMPGVQSAATSSWVPYDGNGGATQAFTIQGKPWRDASETPNASSLIVSPNYLEMMHVPLIRGRELSDRDTADAPLVTLISQSAARKFWPNDDPIGHQIKAGPNDSMNPWMTIVGIVGDVKLDWSDTRPLYAFYRSYRQAPRGYSTIALRSVGDLKALTTETATAVAAVDPEEPVTDILSMETVARNSIIGIEYVVVIMTVIGGLALGLAAIGVYGVMAFTVTERTYEIGVRMAFGARGSDVLRMVIGKGLLLVGIGLCIGIPLALWLASILSSMIFGIGATDPLTFAGIGLSMLIVSFLACWFPARRATRVDPMIALRYE
jgi:putative ABC transport system permease protein